MVRVSVLTPTYNRKDKIQRLFESLVAQTYKNFEWVIVDDGSVDDTRLVVESLKIRLRFLSDTITKLMLENTLL